MTSLHRQIISWLLGVGVTLFAVQNSQVALVQSSDNLWLNGAVIWWPTIGTALIVAAVTAWMMLKSDWRLNFGPKWAWIPLIVIVLSGWLRLLIYHTLSDFAGAALLLLLFAIYLLCRELGGTEHLRKPILVGLAVEIASLILYGLVLCPGQQVGGVLYPSPAWQTQHYEGAVGFVTLSMLLLRGWKWQWVAILFGLVGVSFTGSPELVLFCAVFGVIMAWRRDWGRKAAIALGVPAVVVTLWAIAGPGLHLWQYAEWAVETSAQIVSGQSAANMAPHPYGGNYTPTLSNRFPEYQYALTHINLLGTGYQPTDFNIKGVPELAGKAIANAPLMVLNQLGPLAALAWLFAAVAALWKTKWRYVWLGILLMSLLENYLWTQYFAFFWIFLGLSTSTEGRDLIFKEEAVSAR